MCGQAACLCQAMLVVVLIPQPELILAASEVCLHIKPGGLGTFHHYIGRRVDSSPPYSCNEFVFTDNCVQP